MRIAVDVMGGDHAPDAIVRGCIDALPDLAPGETLVLVGNRADIEEILSERGVRDDRLEVVHSSQVIGMEESPVDAVRGKPDSSIVKMMWLGSKKCPEPVDVVLSAGNTGACVSAATMLMKRLPGVHRPGLAVAMPSFADRPVVLCDAGGNPLPRATHLWQYGIMSAVFSEHALGIENPRVALMNIGSEEGKGTGLIKQTHELLKATPGLNYTGFIEGREFFEGSADVVVTDGFTGNTMLKTAEGLAKSLFQALAGGLFEFDAELALQVEPFFKAFYKSKDYHELGGAPLLGVNGNCVIAHGSSEARTIRSCLRTCREVARTHVNDVIVERLAAAAAVEREAVQRGGLEAAESV